MKNKIKTFSLIIDYHIMKHIRMHNRRNKSSFRNWMESISSKIRFVAILFYIARGAYDANNLKVSFLWNRTWGPKFFSETSRNCFIEIFRFNKKSVRSQRLKIDKFALISEVWNKFIENSQTVINQGQKLLWTNNYFQRKQDADLPNICPISQINLASNPG